MANSAPSAQQCHALTTYYINKYEEIVGSRPLVNRNKAKAGFSGLLMDYTPGQARELVDYYLEHWETPNIQWFIYNYETVDAAKQDRDSGEEIARRRRSETEKRLEEWRKRWQK